MTKMVLAALAALLLLPSAQAHGAPEVLDVEMQLIADEATDLTYAYDGYDIGSVWAREAHRGGQDGVILRIIADGGQSLGISGDLSFAVDIEGQDAVDTYTFTTSDDATWTGDAEVVEVFVTPDETLPAVNVNLQVFLPRSSLGDHLGAVTVRSLAGGQIVDRAPGPVFTPIVPTSVPSVPPVIGPSARLVEELDLDGADGYTTSNVTYDGDTLRITAKNGITTLGQHVFFVPSIDVEDATIGVGDPHEAGRAMSVEPGQDPVFTAHVHADEVFQVEVLTDLGGREVFYVGPDGTVTPTPFEAEGHSHPDEESPGAPLSLLLVGLSALALRRR